MAETLKPGTDVTFDVRHQGRVNTRLGSVVTTRQTTKGAFVVVRTETGYEYSVRPTNVHLI